jgi:hypothetical protein
MARTKPVWCAKAKDGLWCALTPNKCPPEGRTSVQTRCELFISLPWDIDERVPTCPACRHNVRMAQQRVRGKKQRGKETP